MRRGWNQALIDDSVESFDRTALVIVPSDPIQDRVGKPAHGQVQGVDQESGAVRADPICVVGEHDRRAFPVDPVQPLARQWARDGLNLQRIQCLANDDITVDGRFRLQPRFPGLAG